MRAVFGSGVVIVDFLATVQIEIVFLLVGLWGFSPLPLVTARSTACSTATPAPLSFSRPSREGFRPRLNQ